MTPITQLLSDGGVTAAPKVSPFWGRFKEIHGRAGGRSFDRISLFAAGLFVAVAGLVAGLVGTGAEIGAPWWILGGLGAVAAIAERQSVQIGLHTYTSIAAIPLLFTAVVYGPLAAMVVGACALVGDFRAPYMRWVVWTSSRMILGGVTGIVAAIFISRGESIGWLALAVATAAATEAITDMALTSTTVALRHRGKFGETSRALVRLAVATVPFYTPLITILVYAYTELSPWTVLLFVGPAIAAHRLLTMYQEQRKLTEDLFEANGRLEVASVSFAAALVAALDARDRYTAGHSAAVAVYARDIARQLGASTEDQQLAHLAGLLHDIGKVGLPPGILEKEGPLSSSERLVMEQHVVIGERILSNVEDYREIARIVRSHHERYDGMGYPDGLTGNAIPLVSRIIAVADAYNAMTSGRPYRRALDVSVARSRLADAAGSQFDPCVVEAFEVLLDKASVGYVHGAHADFTVEALSQPALVATATAA